MGPIVESSYGSLQGVEQDGMAVFRGVPYAKTPIGSLRFASPRPPEPWRGTRDATSFGPIAMQAANAIVASLNVAPRCDEDCLTLNVWTPSTIGRRPVLVWFHGGAFVTGAGSAPMHDGTELARRGDVVVVTVNYRLGLFGYLRGIETLEGELSTANEGLLDQLAALRWVRDEIAAFGGDPDNVTAVGQSAGAVSISAMLAMPRADRLFHKAILQSGSAALLQTPSSANRVLEVILSHLGLDANQAGQLRDMSAQELLRVQTEATPRARGAVYGPVADGELVPSDPFAAIAAGSAAGIPLLIGTNLEEHNFFRPLDPAGEDLTEEGLLARLGDPRQNARHSDRAQFEPSEAIAVYRDTRAARGEDVSPSDLWFAIMDDRRFRVPGMLQAEMHAIQTPETYAYLFTWRSPAWDGRLGAGHVVEVPFVFGTLAAPDSQEFVPPGSAPPNLASQIQDAWVAFARTGDPATQRLPDWEPYSEPRRRTMLLDAQCVAVDRPREEERSFWAARSASPPRVQSVAP